MICERCNKECDTIFGSGRFCSRLCANSRNRSQETKDKISKSLTGHISAAIKISEKTCTICNTLFLVTGKTKGRTTCSAICSKTRRKQVMSARGRKSAASQQRRSKNEIEFANHCASAFSVVLFNEPMFSGWDADVIIPQLNIAVLWNGPWHYHKITESHSVLQVQNRDRLKIAAIRNAGYKEYVIKDMGSHNPEFVLAEFEKFIRSVR